MISVKRNCHYPVVFKARIQRLEPQRNTVSLTIGSEAKSPPTYTIIERLTVFILCPRLGAE